MILLDIFYLSFYCVYCTFLYLLFSGLEVTCRIRRFINWHVTYIHINIYVFIHRVVCVNTHTHTTQSAVQPIGPTAGLDQAGGLDACIKHV